MVKQLLEKLILMCVKSNAKTGPESVTLRRTTSFIISLSTNVELDSLPSKQPNHLRETE